MRVIYCVTLSFFLISHASQRAPTSLASPLPPPAIHRRDLLASNSQDSLIGEDSHYAECGGHAMASIASVNSELLNQHRLPAASDCISSNQLTEAFNLEEYPYPITTKTPKRSRTKPSRHPSTQVQALGSTSIAPGTLFVTASYAPATVQHGTLSPLRPLYDAGRSPMVATVSSPQSSVLPWVLGFLIPITLGISTCLGIRRNRKNKQNTVSQPIVPDDSYSSETRTSDIGTAVSAEKTGLGIRFDGAHNTSATLILPPVHVQPMNMEISASTTQSDGRQIQEMTDRFELKSAVFPTRCELGHYVFPATAAAVEREVQAEKRADLEYTTHTAPFPTSFSIPRNPMSGRPSPLPCKRIVPKTFGSRIQSAQRKRFSPIGEVLYSTGGADEPLETVHEEANVSDLDVVKTPKAAYKGGEGEFASGPQNEAIPLASSTSYGVSSSPLGLRARRKSSSMIPEVVLSKGDNWSPTLSTESTSVVAPLQISKTKRLSPNHRRSATKSEIFGSMNVLGKPLTSGVSHADEEERKFAEFLKGLVWNAHARDRRSHRSQESMSSVIDLGMASGIAGKPEELNHHTGRPMLLPAPSFGAALSDFGISSSTLASEVPSSSSRFSIGVAL